MDLSVLRLRRKYVMVKVGMMSVNGSASSRNAMIVPLVPPKMMPYMMAEMGAHTVSIHSPMDGMK